jgi:hypothetical protein
MKNITVDYTSTDNCTGPITCLLSVSSDEPISGTGTGDTSPDWEIVDDHSLKLRSERSGSGDGRVYTVTVSCTDEYGNTGTGTKTVLVPHDMSLAQIRKLVFQYWFHGNGNGNGHRTGVIPEEIINSGSKNIIVMNEEDPENSTFIRVYPNPSRNYFTMNIEAMNDREKISVRIIDVAGRVVEVKNNLSGSQSLRFGEKLKAGIYFAEIRQGIAVKQFKLVKQ